MAEFRKSLFSFVMFVLIASLSGVRTEAPAAGSSENNVVPTPVSTFESDPSSYYRGQRQAYGYGGYGGYQQPYYSGYGYQRPYYNNYNQGYNTGYSGYNNGYGYNGWGNTGYQGGNYYNSYQRPYYNSYSGGGGYGGGVGIFPQPVRDGYL